MCSACLMVYIIEVIRQVSKTQTLYINNRMSVYDVLSIYKQRTKCIVTYKASQRTTIHVHEYIYVTLLKDLSKLL